jgi:putative oxidoreductase
VLERHLRQVQTDDESWYPMAEQITREQQPGRIEDVRGSGIYPATGPHPPGDAIVRTPGALGHPEERHTVHWTNERVEPWILFAGRLIFGGYFLYNGINHFLERESLVDYAKSKGVQAPEAAVAGSGLLILGGGLSIVTGASPKLGAALISTFLLGVSPRMHAFWREQDPQQRMNEMVNFTKNMALVGASLVAAAHPEPWPWSVTVNKRQMLPALA